MRSGSLAYLIARGVTASLLVGAITLIPKAASAFCRITTTETAIDGADTMVCYDTSHPPVWWPGACIGLSVQKDGSQYASYSVVDDLLFQTVLPNWMNADCPAGGHPSIAVFDTGPVACNEQQANVYGPNANVVMFHDGSGTATGAWPYGDDAGDPDLTIALTTVTFHPETGALWDADMEINSASHPISTTSPVPPGYYDLQSILQHETGHVLGLAHPPVPAAVMYYAYSTGSDGKRVLNSDDINGICTIYPPSGERSVGPSIADGGLVAEGTCDATPRNGFSSACVSDAGDQPPPEPSAACTCHAGRAIPPSGVGVWGAAGVSLAWAVRRRRRGRHTAAPRRAHP
jgi:MYXO-CTERM domain-containing protein